MGKPIDFLSLGQIDLLGNIIGKLDIEIPDFDNKEDCEKWFDELCDQHIVQTGRIRWEIVEDKENFMKNMGYEDDEEMDDLDAESPFEQFFFDLGDL